MDTTLKNTSIRCDLHPPLSAIMYCDKCCAFLCRICAEVRPGGRVCATCQKACREPSAAEFAQLVETRRKAKEDASIAKAAESRIKDQLAKAKVDREARLKAEFAARKAALAQGPQPPGTKTPSMSAQPFPSQFKPASNSVPVSAMGGTMYNPNDPVPVPAARDPLAKLGERAHLNVIGRAKNYMIFIGGITFLVGVVAFLVVASVESTYNTGETNSAQQTVDDVKADLMKYKSKEQQAADKARAAEQRALDEQTRAENQTVFFWAKLTWGICIVVGLTLIVLFFLSDSYPREATAAAFGIYLVMVLFDLGFIRPIRVFGVMAKLAALTALYNGMVAGSTLHNMRVEEAAAG